MRASCRNAPRGARDKPPDDRDTAGQNPAGPNLRGRTCGAEPGRAIRTAASAPSALRRDLGARPCCRAIRAVLLASGMAGSAAGPDPRTATDDELARAYAPIPAVHVRFDPA